MLVTSYSEPFAATVFFGDEKQLVQSFMIQRIASVDTNEYEGKRIVIKGCEILTCRRPPIAITQKLRPVVKSLMYGEPCSTVPVYKSPGVITNK